MTWEQITPIKVGFIKTDSSVNLKELIHGWLI